MRDHFVKKKWKGDNRVGSCVIQLVFSASGDGFPVQQRYKLGCNFDCCASSQMCVCGFKITKIEEQLNFLNNEILCEMNFKSLLLRTK